MKNWCPIFLINVNAKLASKTLAKLLVLPEVIHLIALGTIAIKVREDDSINGITIQDESVKLSLFADDMNCFLKDSSSYTNPFVSLKTFGEISDLKNK